MHSLPFGGWTRAIGVPCGLMLTAGLGLLLACSDSQPLSIAALRLPVEAVPGAVRLEIKSELKDTGAAGGQVPLAMQALRSQHIVESAYFKYHLGPEKPGSYKVKMSIYTDAGRRAAAWAAKYPPAMLDGTEPRPWGDQGFVVPGRMGAFGLGRVYLQIEAVGEPPGLEALVEAFLERAQALQ